MESEWKAKYEHVCEEMRELKGKLVAEKEMTGVENSRLKVGREGGREGGGEGPSS